MLIFLIFLACDTPVITEYITEEVIIEKDYPSYIYIAEPTTSPYDIYSRSYPSVGDAIEAILTMVTDSNNEFIIMLSGTIKESNITIDYKGSTNLTITFLGFADGAVLDANASSSVLSLRGENLHVVLGKDITLTNGHSSEGGGVFVFESALTIDGANISKNSAYFAGGGVFVKNGALNIYDGVITSNSATGKSDSKAGADDNFIGHGGGVYLTGSKDMNLVGEIIELVDTFSTFNFSGGEISHNTATGQYGGGSGGGVYLNFNTKGSISGGAVIRDNSSDYYAGLCAYMSDFTIISGRIENNYSKYTDEDHNL